MKSKRIFRRIPREEKGAAAVEFALGSLVFFTVLFAIIEFGIMFWVNLTMQHAVREGARYAITGRTDLDPEDNLRTNAVIQKIKNSSVGLYDKVSPEVRVTDQNGNSLSGFGGDDQIIVIAIECTWPVLTPIIRPFFLDGNYKFTVRTAMKNEAFSP